MVVMDMLWDDPDLLEDDIFGDDDYWDTDEALIIHEDDEREAKASAAMRQRCKGLNEWDLDPDDLFYD